MIFPLTLIFISSKLSFFLKVNKMFIPPSFKLASESRYKDMNNSYIITSMICLVNSTNHGHLSKDIYDTILWLSIYVPFIDVTSIVWILNNYGLSWKSLVKKARLKIWSLGGSPIHYSFDGFDFFIFTIKRGYFRGFV